MEAKRIDEARLGLAWVHANMWEWDELFGPPPPDFEFLPQWGETPCKHQYLLPKMRYIERVIGDAGTSKAWWVNYLGTTEEEWRKWYFGIRTEEYSIAKELREVTV